MIAFYSKRQLNEAFEPPKETTFNRYKCIQKFTKTNKKATGLMKKQATFQAPLFGRLG